MQALYNVGNNKNEQFTEAYNSYYPLIFSLVYSKLQSIDETDDICQDIFMLLYNKFDEIDNHRKWLYGTMRNVMLKYYEKKNKDATHVDNIIEDVTISFVNGFRDTRLIIQEALDDINNFKNEKERLLFELISINNYTFVNASKYLGLTYDQVRYSYDQTVKRLKDYFKNKGINNLEELL